MNLNYRLSNDYVRGLVDGEGCFTFYTNTKMKDGKKITIKIPAFSLRMHHRDIWLLEGVCTHLRLDNNVYMYKAYRKDGAKRGAQASFVIRSPESLKNIIIPFFYKKLAGYKGRQFIEWLENIGSYSDVPDRYKTLYELYKSGYWDDPKNTPQWLT